MPLPDPLPFRLRVPGDDRVDLGGVHSISWQFEGLLHHLGDRLRFEWSGTRSVQSVSLSRTVDRAEPIPPEELEVPVEWIAEAVLTGALWLPGMELRARRIDAFDGIPGARGGRVSLRFKRRHLDIARRIVRELNR